MASPGPNELIDSYLIYDIHLEKLKWKKTDIGFEIIGYHNTNDNNSI